jgi:hypothetical protein
MGDRKEIVFPSNAAEETYPHGVIEMPIRWSDNIKQKVDMMIARQGCAPVAIMIHADATGIDYTLSFVWPNTHAETK